MEGLKERNPNIVRTHSKRLDRMNYKLVSAEPSKDMLRSNSRRPGTADASEGSKSAKKVGLDDEEMLFLARRCLAEEQKSRPKPPAVFSELVEPQAAHPVHQAASLPQPPEPIVQEITVPAPAPAPQVLLVSPVIPPQSNAVPVLAQIVLDRPLIRHRPGFLSVHRLGAGLLVLKFGWVWMSCGGYIAVDTAVCSGDICMFILRRLRKHASNVGSRLQAAARESVKLFTDYENGTI